MLPTFIVIGAMKAGTTSLARYVDGHPDAFVSRRKEPDYFTANWDQGRDWYESLFVDAGAAKAVGEASTSYTKYPSEAGVPARIASLLPDVRLVYLIRDPVDRIRSMWVHRTSRLDETRPCADAVVEQADYLDFSRYGMQLDQYLEVFERDQLLVMRSEDLRDHRSTTLSTIFTFLGLDPDAPVEGLDVEYNAGRDRRVRTPAARAVVRGLRKTRLMPVIPRRLRKPVWQAMGRAVPVAEIPPDVEDHLWTALAPDLARLRQIVGPEMDLWGRA